jgi:hypothetical protein
MEACDRDGKLVGAVEAVGSVFGLDTEKVSGRFLEELFG